MNIEISEKQAEYIRNANHRWNGKVGATQCGKTYVDTLFVIPNRIIERSGKKGLNVITGVSKETITRNIIEPLQEIYGSKAITDISSNNTCYIMGEKVYCLGADNKGRVSKFRGSRIKYLYIDEIVDINQEVFQLLKSRLSFEYSCCDFAGNPQTPTHPIKEFIDSDIDIYVQHYTIYDNPFLPKEYIKQLEKEYEGTVYFHRYILGNWMSAEGLIFPMIANDKFRYLKNNEFGGIITLGIDWGGNKSAHTITATRISHDYKRIQVLKHSKMVATGTDTVKIFKWIIDFIKEIQLTYGHITAIFPDSAEQVLKNSLITELRNNNIYIDVLDSDKIPIEDRIHLLTIYFNLDLITFNEVGTDVLISALSSALFDDKSKTDRWIDDGETSDIDSLDSFCYSWTYFSDRLTLK